VWLCKQEGEKKEYLHKNQETRGITRKKKWKKKIERKKKLVCLHSL
jgi:hypothetical protein